MLDQATYIELLRGRPKVMRRYGRYPGLEECQVLSVGF